VYLIELSLPGIASVTCAAVRQPKGGLHPEMQYRSGHKTTDEV
jgi:hypothetical protein